MYIFIKQINLYLWALVIGIISSRKYFKPQYLGHWSELIPSKLVLPEDSRVLDFEEEGHTSTYVSVLCLTKFAGEKKRKEN